MRYIDILLEFDLQKTIQNYGDKLLERVKVDHSAKNKPIEEIINYYKILGLDRYLIEN